MKMKKKETILKLYNNYIEEELKPTEEYRKISHEFIDKIESFRNELEESKKEELIETIDLI